MGLTPPLLPPSSHLMCSRPGGKDGPLALFTHFLSSVRCLLSEFGEMFEFNERLLLFLFDSFIDGRFDTFVFENEVPLPFILSVCLLYPHAARPRENKWKSSIQ